MADLPERLFEGMSQLYSLIIKNADLEQIPPTLFRPLSNLMALDLTGNKLRIEPQALGSLTNLIQLDMSNNSIPFLANTLASLHHLKILEMDHNELTNIDFRRFPPSLTDLSLRHNSINTIHFINESVSQLRRLDLSGNALENVASTGTVNVFPHSIRLLDISFNRISYITDNAFAHLQKLTTIDIRNNHLTEIKETALRAKANEQRRQVFVSGNPLKCSCSIQWMIHPENKEIPLVMDASQATCTSLVHLDANMSLSEAYSSQQFLCKYQSECLEGCECCLRPLGECRCQSTCPPGCTCWRSASASLRVPGENVVSCHRVRIDRLTPIPTMVTELHFPDVRMDAIGIDAIGRRDHLVLLNVSNSRISGLTQEALSQFPRLQTLDMSNTHIEALPHNALRSNPALTTLYLHDNKLKNIDLSVLSTLSSTSLKHLTLGGNRNQFTCSCTVPSDMQIWLLSSDTRKKISDFDDIQCKFDETNTMVYLYEIDPLQNGTLCVSMSTTSSTVSPTLDQTPSIGVSQSSRKASVTTKPFPTAATILTHSSEATLEEEEPPTDIILSTRVTSS
ncbi:hypothetical protein QR680_002342 [Steinernema hermaphroditum]|uniref:Leucine Rich repeat-containing domain protein n=1 Tax=Steinernema hermaphroditum TaxID=289476 RepID=A0AA39H2D2_9BILA|nr:hypothetical protein QR680_002342 [Steinernema hermaphroditum]